ncbi:19474_t:CDS:2 [Cetraspora pellucida]|uniref:19474_t:CDS:1 n=1 Tax=Cetraspora pellucida TaxID=1433469 RepID=A0A9N9HC16_9GLOM|nr:19474_t:CDS:2 [Cetraspora pellucida]
MSQSQPQIPEVGDEFPIAENFKEMAQQGGGKGDHIPFITLQCTMGAVLNKNTRTWVVTSSKSMHNHELLIPSQIHCLPQHRYLNTEQKELVHIMLKSGASTQSIADGTNHDTTMRLIKMLEEHQYILHHLLIKNSHMLNLFFTYIEAVHQVAICPEVLIINATYKINLYKLPLINAVGISNIGNAKALNTYQIAMAWVANEQEPTYEWFLFILKETIYDIFFVPQKYLFQTGLWPLEKQQTRKFFDSDEEYNEFLLTVQKVAYAEEMNEVEKAFKEVSQTIMKSRDPEYIQNYLEEWKKDTKCWMHVFTKNYLHMGTQSTQRVEGSHSTLKKAIEASSGLEQVFLHIDCAFRQCQLQTNGALDSNIVSADPFIHNDKSLRLNYKLLCRHIIPPTGPVLLNLVHKCWHLKHDSVSSIPLSLLIDITISKVLYKLKEKYEHLNDKISIPKAPLYNVSTLPKRHLQSIKRNPLLSEYQEKIPIFMHKYIKKVVNIDEDGNCKYRAVAVGLGRNENKWPNIRKKLFEELNKNEPFY